MEELLRVERDRGQDDINGGMTHPHQQFGGMTHPRQHLTELARHRRFRDGINVEVPVKAGALRECGE